MCNYGEGEYAQEELDELLWQHPLAPYTNGDSEASHLRVMNVWCCSGALRRPVCVFTRAGM